MSFSFVRKFMVYLALSSVQLSASFVPTIEALLLISIGNLTLMD